MHTEFLKFGEIVNFKVCKNSSYHLRGNLYVHYKSLESAIIAYNTMNARYYAGKQIFCEFAGVTKWKVAICGEFMKSRLKTCSHGSACNFIHCFRNPGGDYEWADWDNPPPRFWVKQMVVLFGTSAESSYDKELEPDDYHRHREPERMRTSRGYRHQSERSHYSSSDGDETNSKKSRNNRHLITKERSSKRSRHHVSADENEQRAENGKSEEHVYSRSFYFCNDESVEGFSKKHGSTNLPGHHSRHERRQSEDGSSSRRKRKAYSEERDNSKRNGTPKSREKRDQKHDKKYERKHDSLDQHLDSSDHWDSFSRHSSGSPNRFDVKYFHEDSESEEDFTGARYSHHSHSGKRRK